MNKEENNNHILIEVLNNDGDLKLTKFRNPQAIWQNNNYPDEYVFKDVDYINIFQLMQENKQLKEEIKRLKMIVYGLNNRDLFSKKICEYINKIEEELNWEEYLKFQGDK